MKCPYCREEIEDNSQICSICGENIAVPAILKIFKILPYVWILSSYFNNDTITRYISLIIIVLYWVKALLFRTTNLHLPADNKFLEISLYLVTITCLCDMFYIVPHGYFISHTTFIYCLPVLLLSLITISFTICYCISKFKKK